MRLFQPNARARSQESKRIYAVYEIWYTVVDVTAAVSFLVGSFLFLGDASKTAGTWLFIIGSFFFLMKPVIRLLREVRFLALGDVDTLAHRAGWRPREPAIRPVMSRRRETRAGP
jgi:hypothetical protein